MATAIRPIKTIYKGYRFRSRLEARWAVFFDALGIPFEYEKEGFELPGGLRYLPDFWLPEQDCWVEIKGQDPVGVAPEFAKAAALAKVTNKNVYMFIGPIPEPHNGYLVQNGGSYLSAYSWRSRDFYSRILYRRFPEDCYIGGELVQQTSPDEWQCWWRECPGCGLLSIANSAECCFRDCCGNCHSSAEASPTTPRLQKAYVAARSARFEFGEN